MAAVILARLQNSSKKVGVFKWLRHFIYSDIFIQHLSCSVMVGQAAKTQAVFVPRKLPFLQLRSETSSSVCPKTDLLSDFYSEPSVMATTFKHFQRTSLYNSLRKLSYLRY